MQEKRKKYGWTEKGIIGLIFTPMGVLFLTIGLVLCGRQGFDREERLAFLFSFVGVGGVFLLTGAVLLALDLRRRARQRAAYEGGYVVRAKIAGVRTNSRVDVNGRHPVTVECHYTDPATGIAHVYFSRYVYVNVADLLQSDEVPLYLDRSDESAGFVDIDAILPEIRVHR